MHNFFLNKPFHLARLFTDEKLRHADLGRSISNNIELIIFTRKGEHRFNADYGCEIWDLDFELIVSEMQWEERFRKSLLRSIRTYERRIVQVYVNVQISEVEQFLPQRKVTEIKKKVLITIDAKMRETGERYYFGTSLYLSPLSK